MEPDGFELGSACRNGKPHLLVRIGNTRGNFLLHPEVRGLVDDILKAACIRIARAHNLSMSRYMSDHAADLVCGNVDPYFILPEACDI